MSTIKNSNQGIKTFLFIIGGLILVVTSIAFLVSQAQKANDKNAHTQIKPQTDIVKYERTAYAGSWTSPITVPYGWCARIQTDKRVTVKMVTGETFIHDPFKSYNKISYYPLRFQTIGEGPDEILLFAAPPKTRSGGTRDCRKFQPEVELREHMQKMKNYLKYLNQKR